MGFEYIFKEGVCVIVVNYFGGIVDGLVFWDVIRVWRLDVVYFVNCDVFKVCYGLEECIILVEWCDNE